MNELLRYFGRLRLAALALTLLPLAAVPVAGTFWLWQSGWLLYWVAAMLACGLVAYGLHRLARWRELDRATDSVTAPSEHWSATADGAWQQVQDLAERVEPADYSLADGASLWQLARHTLERVAGHYYPDREQPILELTVPHTLLIVERASRELRQQVTDSVPFSHRLTLGSLARARRWHQSAARYHNAYRLGRAVVSPASAIYKEFNRAVGGQLLDYGGERLQRWLLQEYVRKVGFYAIELYSGNLLLSGDWPAPDSTDGSMRLLVLGPAGTGKSSLIEALAGARGEPAPEAGGKQLEAQRLDSPRWGPLVLWDTPAWDLMLRRRAKRAVTRADLIVWVTRADRLRGDYEAGQLRRIQRWLGRRAGQPEPPLLVALTHAGPGPDRAAQAARELGIARERVLCVSLADPHNTEVAEQLAAAIDVHRPQAVRSQYWRHLHRQRENEHRELTGQQLRGAGRSAWQVAKGLWARGRR